MVWNYDPAQSRSTDKIRFHIGDTDHNKQLLQDEEIDYLYSQHGSIFAAAAQACRNIAAKLARDVTKSYDGLSRTGSDLFNHYMKLAADLDSRVEETAVVEVPSAGGLVDAITGLDKPPMFWLKMHDNKQWPE